MDVVILHGPERCARCQCPLQGEDGQHQRHQVKDIPAVKPRVTEYQLHRLGRPVCGKVHRAELPVGAPHGGFVPRRVQAITALWTGAYLRSRRTNRTVLTAVRLGLCDIELSS
jgi:hypothetical protein